MANFDQQNQRVNTQHNAGRDIRFSQRNTGFNQRSQHIERQTNVGRDHIRVSNTYNTGTSARTVLARGIVIVVVLLVLGGSAVLAAGPAANTVSGFFTGFFNSITHGNSPKSDLNKMLYGEPQDSLKQFCHNLQSGALQDAYDIYSDHLKSQVTLANFTNKWGDSHVHVRDCTSNITNHYDTSANGTIYMKFFHVSGDPDTNAEYKVTLVSSDGIWKIDSMDGPDPA